MFHRLIYISRSLVGADHDEVEAIVSSSIRWNTEADVTGMLWADGSSFAQVIEGDPGMIGRTMDRIRADRRHSDIAVVFDRPVLSRQFGSWSMRQAGNDEASVHGTTFMIGFAMRGRTPLAKRLYEIVVASNG